jgi:hypothetical protein
MKDTILRSVLAALACTAALAIAGPSMAANVNLKADLKASSEVPPTDSKGSGSVTATYDTASKKLSWKGSVSGLSGPATAAQLPAPTRAHSRGLRPSPMPRRTSCWRASGMSTSTPRPTKAAKSVVR